LRSECWRSLTGPRSGRGGSVPRPAPERVVPFSFRFFLRRTPTTKLGRPASARFEVSRGVGRRCWSFFCSFVGRPWRPGPDIRGPKRRARVAGGHDEPQRGALLRVGTHRARPLFAESNEPGGCGGADDRGGLPRRGGPQDRPPSRNGPGGARVDRSPVPVRWQDVAGPALVALRDEFRRVRCPRSKTPKGVLDVRLTQPSG